MHVKDHKISMFLKGRFLKVLSTLPKNISALSKVCIPLLPYTEEQDQEWHCNENMTSKLSFTDCSFIRVR